MNTTRRKLTEGQRDAILNDVERFGLQVAAEMHNVSKRLLATWKTRKAEIEAVNNHGLNSDAAQIWVHLRDDGQWLSAQAIHDHWHPTYQLSLIEAVLRLLISLGAIERRSNIEAAGQHVYAVTDDCEALPSYKLEKRSC